VTYWASVPLEKCIATIRAGISVAGEARTPRQDEVGILTLGAVSGGKFAPEACKALPASAAQGLGAPVRAGTLLMSRSNTIDLVGAAVLVEEDHPDRYLPDLLWEVTLRDDSPIAPAFLTDFLATDAGRRLLQSAAMGTSGSMKKLSMRRVRALQVPLVAPELQYLWGRLRRAYSSTATALGQLLAARREFKRRLMYALLTGRRRFPEFTDAETSWVRLGEHADELLERNRAGMGPERVMGVLKGIGLSPMRDHVRAADLSRYMIVPPQGFAYNPMRLNIGSIARNLFGTDCLVSPDYVVFKTNGETLLPAYLDQLRRSHIWSSFVQPAGTGSVRVRIYFQDLAELRIPLPSLAEQRRIAGLLDSLDCEAQALQRLRGAYEAQKRGLMQRLLAGELALPEPTTGRPELAHA
jgi:type I restriction enzyme, S subunit